MWACWFPLALFTMATNRYLRSVFRKHYITIHSISGILIVCTTIVIAMLAWKHVGWKVKNNTHSYFAFPVLFLVLFIGVLGITTRFMLRYSSWKTKTSLTLKFTHKLLAYSAILFAALAASFGIYHYRVSPKHPFAFPLEWVHASCFIVILVASESIYRLC